MTEPLYREGLGALQAQAPSVTGETEAAAGSRPVGSITASCGCKLTDGDEGREVNYSGESCDWLDGFKPCVHYAWYCTACADKARQWPEFLATHEAADAWLEAQR